MKSDADAFQSIRISSPPGKKNPLLRSIIFLTCCFTHFLRSCAPQQNMITTLHFWVLCRLYRKQADKSASVHSAELIEQKVTHVIILSIYKMWDLYFRMISCHVEQGKNRKTILIYSMNMSFAIFRYWKCSVVLVRWRTVVHAVVCHCSSICLFTTYLVHCLMSQHLEKPQISPVLYPAMLNWPPPVTQAVSGLRSVCSRVLSAIQPSCPQSCFFLRYKVIVWSQINSSNAH